MVAEVPVSTLMPTFTIVAFKMWAYGPKIVKNGNFGINLTLKENPRGP